MKRLLIFSGLMCLLSGHSLTLAKPSNISGPQELLASPLRPQVDRTRDATRKPVALLAFAGVTPGQSVANLMPGSGYFTRLISLAVGPSGHVYAVIPAELIARHPKTAETAQSIAANPSFGNVSVVVTPIVDFHVVKPLDLVWISQNYHDVYGTMGVETARRMDRAIFQALKPHGIFLVIDQMALSNTGASTTTTLQRIDPGLIVQQVESVGFRFVGSSPVLHNLSDAHGLPVFDPSNRGKTDQVVLKFEKPTGPLR